MGENQFTKLMRQGRDGKLGMIKPTLEQPHAIVEDESEAKEDDVTERASSYVFIRSFKKADGSRYYYFTSVTVSKDGKEVVISNQEKRRKAIANLLINGKLVWKHADDVSTASDVADGLYSSQGNLSDPTTEGTVSPQTNISDSKDTTIYQNNNELGEKSVVPSIQEQVQVAEAPAKAEAPTISQGTDQVSDIQRLATEAVVHSLEASGIEVVQATDAMAEAVLGMGGVEMSAKKKRALETASVQEEHQPTVVSSADGAKILNNLDNVATEYEEKSNQPKTFLGDVAKALGAERKGSGSQYVTFETKNGKVVTIRLSNHNAMVSNFDNNGESDGISIVVSAKGNIGITNDGDAHIVEHYYDAIKLRRAEGKPLAEIVRSIKQALYSGEFIDTTGLAERQEVNLNETEAQIVYHGSSAKFDAFDHSHMGEGEGAQAYGWGTYVTEVENIGKQYAITMRDKAITDKHKENATINNLARQTLASNNGNKADALDYLRGLLNESWSDKKRVKAQIKIIETGKFLPETKVKAQLYTVEIPDDTGSNYLYWDKEVPKEVIKSIQNKLNLPKLYFHSAYPMTGERVYDALKKLSSGRLVSVSKFLNKIGFVGIKYPAQFRSGGRSDGKSNYVIFNETDANIVGRVEFLRTPQGTIYGWTDGKKIYLTKDGMNPETPIHEYTHIWAKAMMQGNPDGWQSIKELLRGTPIWDEVMNDPNYADIRNYEDAVASEALSRMSGKENSRRMEQEARRMIDEAQGVFEKAEATTLVERMRKALREFWNWVGKSLFDIKSFGSIEEVTDRVLWDLIHNSQLNVESSQSAPIEKQIIGERGAESLDRSEEATHRMDNLALARKMEAEFAEMDATVETANDLATAEEADELEREGVGSYTDEELALESDPVSKVLGKPRGTRKQRREFAQRERQRMVERVESLAKKLHLDNVEVVTDVSTPPARSATSPTQSAREDLEKENRATSIMKEKKIRAKGFYSKSTGKITIVIPNHSSASDVEQTLLHEAVAHYGLRQLFGEHFDTFLDNVFNNAEKSISQCIEAIRKNLYRKYVAEAIKGVTSVFEQAEIIANLSKTEKDFTHTATEEYLASLAETTDFENTSASWWRKIKDLFFEMLEKIGFGNFRGVTMSDNELRYILWRSYENLREPGRHRSIFGEAADVVKQWELGVGQYESATGQLIVADGEASAPSTITSIEAVNRRFNDELQQQIEGKLPQGHIYQLGMPSEVLLSCGIANAPIQLNSSRLKDKSSNFGHDYELSEIKDLVKALNNPIALFAYGNKSKAQNIVVEIQHENKNFIIGLSIRPTVNGRVLDINSIRNVFPKDNAEWLNWISQGKAIFLNKEKIQDLIDQQRTNLADVEYLDLDSITKIVKEFENPNKIPKRGNEEIEATLSETINKRFNEQLENLTDANARETIFDLGMPSEVLTSCGIENKPIRLYGSKVIAKSKKHGYTPIDLRNLPKSLNNPIAVFSGSQMGSYAILTEIQIDGKNVLVSIIVGKGGHDVDFNIITSAYGKNSDNITRWINDGKLLYADKTRALDYLSVPAPIAGAQNNQELVLATKIVKEFENPNKEEGTVNIDKLLSEYHQTFKGDHPSIIILKDKSDLYEYAVSEGASESESEEFSEQFIKEKSIGGYDPETNKIVIFAWNKGNYYATLFHEHVHYAIEQSGGIKHFETLVKELKELDPRLLRKVSKLYQEQEIDEEIITYSLESALYGEAIEDLSEVLSSEGQKLLEKILDKIGYEGRRNYGKEVASYEPDTNRAHLAKKQSRTRRRIEERGGRMVRGGNRVGSEGESSNGQAIRETDGTSGENTGPEGNGLLSKIHQRRGEFKTKRGNEEIEEDVLYREGEPEVRERVQARERYERRVNSGMFQSQEAIQDSMLSLKEAMESILGRKVYIEDIAGYENAYIGENRLSSVNKAECDGLAQVVFRPMLEEVAKLAHNEAERLELIDYMMAKHGLERNEDMREQAKQNGKKTDRDFAGLTALTGIKDVYEAEVEAEHMVIDYEKTHDTGELWKKVKAVSKAILQKSYESGLISKETYDELSNRYEYYIPLRGFDEKTSNESYAYLSHKDSAFNAPIKKARGRSSKADDPFANLESMAESTIMQGNRNRLVKQRFFDFVMNHPSDLVSVSELWLSYNEAKDEWEPVVADNIREDDSAEEVERKTKEFESRMTQLSKQYPDRYKKGKDAIGIPYRVKDKGNLQEHQVIVKRGGVDYVLTVNGNPRLSQALNGLTNPDNDVSGAIGSFLRLGESLNRRLSAFYTTRNPDFVISNFVRDILYSNSMVWIKESPNYALRFHKNCLEFHPAKMRRLLSKYRRGELNMNDKTEAMFYRFMRNGGETGYVNIRDIERHKHDIKRELRKSQGRVPIEKAWDLLGEQFDELNRSVENCARFAAFVTSREMGRSIDRAIYDAKEISVNFNKKGSGAKFHNSVGQTWIGNASALVSGFGRSSYVFWNAGIQGSTNFGRQVKRHPVKALTGMATMYLLGSIVAYMGMDDEEDKNAYYNLPEYVRRSNIMFRSGDHWISIPLPIEYRAIYGMGELMMSVMSGKERMTDGELAESIAGQVSQVLPLDFMEGGGGWNAFVPSAAKPIIEAYITERSWTGLPLYKDNPWNEHAPEWTKAYSSANKYLVDLSMALNEASGGDEYRRGWFNFNPSKVEYLLNGYFGGVASTIDKMVKMGETWFGDREYDPRSFLLWNRIVKAGDERTAYRAVNREYYRLLEESEETKRVLRGYEQSTNKGVLEYAEKMDFLYNSAEYGRYEIYKEYQEYIDMLEKMLDESSDAEEMKMLDGELNEVKKALINECEKVK